MENRYFLGVDGGGTQTRVLLADERGRICGEGRGGSTNRNHHSRDEVRENLRQAVRAALAGRGDGGMLAGVFMGMCGVSNDDDRRDIVSIAREISELGPTVPVRVDNDSRAGLTGGLPGRPGIVLIAGTGSACYGATPDGRDFWCGGWGAMVDDVGSGPWIGLQAMRAAVRSEDGRTPPTVLRQAVFEFLGLRDSREFLDRVHNRGLEREEIGRLAPKVIEAYARGDAVAGGILDEAAAELSLLVGTVAKKLFDGRPCELILVGGVARSGPPFQPMLCDRIVRDTPTVAVREPELSPVQGAVLEALRAGGIKWSGDVLANVRSFKG
jgi:N-acetylglucosamine kinase-like BadF-type ATPase